MHIFILKYVYIHTDKQTASISFTQRSALRIWLGCLRGQQPTWAVSCITARHSYGLWHLMLSVLLHLYLYMCSFSACIFCYVLLRFRLGFLISLFIHIAGPIHKKYFVWLLTLLTPLPPLSIFSIPPTLHIFLYFFILLNPFHFLFLFKSADTSLIHVTS